MTAATGTPADNTHELDTLVRSLDSLINRRTAPIRSDLDQLQGALGDVRALRAALDTLQTTVDNHSGEIGDLGSRLNTAAAALAGAGRIVAQQARNSNAGDSVDSDALAQSRREFQEIARQLQETAATAASRLERIEGALEMDPETGRSGVLDRHGWDIHHLRGALDMDATGNSGHVSQVRALLGLDREDGQPNVIDELTTGQREIAGQVGSLNSVLLMEGGHSQRLNRAEERIAALENQGGSLGKALGIGAVVGLVVWMFVALVFAIPGLADIVIGIGTMVIVTGIAMYVLKGSNCAPATVRPAPAPPTRVLPAQQADNGQPAGTPAGQA